MNIKKNSIFVLAAVFGVSVILYVLDVPIIQPKTFPIQISTTPLITPFATIQQPRPTNIVSAKRNFLETIDYQVRGFGESIDVSVNLKNNIVSDLKINHTPKDGESVLYHDSFDGEIRPLVVGKNIKEVNVSRVAGASFTTDAFMQAVDKIRSQI